MLLNAETKAADNKLAESLDLREKKCIKSPLTVFSNRPIRSRVIGERE